MINAKALQQVFAMRSRLIASCHCGSALWRYVATLCVQFTRTNIQAFMDRPWRCSITVSGKYTKSKDPQVDLALHRVQGSTRLSRSHGAGLHRWACQPTNQCITEVSISLHRLCVVRQAFGSNMVQPMSILSRVFFGTSESFGRDHMLSRQPESFLGPAQGLRP